MDHSSRHKHSKSLATSGHSNMSSPHFAQSNSFVEKMIGAAKNLIKKSVGRVIEFAATDNKLGSPMQRLFSRWTRSQIPVLNNKLKPEVIEKNPKPFSNSRQQQSKYFNCSKFVPEFFEVGDHVFIRNHHRVWVTEIIENKADTPRSYIVRIVNGNLYQTRDEWFIKQSSA